MKFTTEKKHSIIMYLLEQIDKDKDNVSKNVAEKCRISRNTVNQYLHELQEKNIIRKVKRNQYTVLAKTFTHYFYRSANELISETAIFERCIQEHLEDCTPEAKRIWEYAISEMVNNVIDHSESEELVVILKKTYLTTTVFLQDRGIGIFEKIRKHFSLDTLEDARCELFKGKLTTDEKNHSGEGIFFTSKMMDVFIIESDGLTFASDKYDAELTIQEEKPAEKGTCVYMKLSNFTHRHIVEVFDQYANVEGGFTVTRIPLRHMFDNAPVSRSQAKRLCNRLDKFQEVILDFTDLDWMGQAFAHQLFVLYQNDHPETQLNPINMGEEVEKMYRHVLATSKA